MAEALPEWYHGPISKTECEELLGKKNKDGAYLLRDSETIQGAMCLCVYKQKVVYTYRVLQTHNGNYTLLTAGGIQETYFKTLEDLIRNYKRKNQGLAIHLRHALKRKTDMLIRPRKSSESSPRNQAGVSPRPSSMPPGGVPPRPSATLPAGVSSRASATPPAGVSSRASATPPAGVSSRASAMPPAGVSSRASATPPDEASDRLSVGRPVRHALRRDNNPLPEEDCDYENDPISEYVEVLPDQL
ncbi:phosphatidylinositol 3,4,5-trisphosphate 5-phosphatase 1-like [Melanotaenia boesemani]|uniref:phosphatidylinositol 3,4,5-trisphosphate 5-phosphatase 1-like n=1 Tax=Melanotaenia boesemani TaxID=1250792 RepID=UPI001C04D581|nr:phosphatidylinositol 3,4,5-trisphosphate 5-phosphatase 1-like [Melanotaenia boesemani]